MKIKKFVNNILSSNSYILYFDERDSVFVIDPGESNHIFHWLSSNSKFIKGIFITHSHFDHIFGINDLLGEFPEIIVYASSYTKVGMMSEVLNGSRYHDTPYIVNRQDISIIKEGDIIPLWDDVSLTVLETPGHDRDCMSYQVEKNLFTGDSLIPGIKVFTRSKYSDKTTAAYSINRIFEQFDDDTILWPGHLDSSLLGTLKSK